MSLADLTLDPTVAVDATFLVDGRPLRWIEPAIALFLAPELVAVLEQLGTIVHDALQTVATDAAVRGQVFPREKAGALVQSLIEKHLAGHSDTWPYLEAARDTEGRLRLTPKPEGFEGFVATDRVVIELRFTRGAKSVSSSIPLSSARALAVIMDVLRGDYPPGLDLALADRDVRGVIAALESIGGLIPKADAGPLFVPDAHDATVLTATHMGHAFLIVDGGSRRVLFDPVLQEWRDQFEQQPLTARQLGPVDAIFFSHHHTDYMDLASLLLLPHRVPVFVPGGTDQPMMPHCADYLRMLGFTDVREMSAGDTAPVGVLEIKAFPYSGEGRDVLGFAANTFIAALGSQSILICSDSSPDNSGRSIMTNGEVARWVASRGPIRVIYGRWRQQRRFLCLLSPLALVRADIPSDRWLQDVECGDSSGEYLVNLVKTTRARKFITYAEGLEEDFLPPTLASGRSRADSLLWKSRSDVCLDITRRTAAETLAAKPYQQIRLE